MSPRRGPRRLAINAVPSLSGATPSRDGLRRVDLVGIDDRILDHLEPWRGRPAPDGEPHAGLRPSAGLDETRRVPWPARNDRSASDSGSSTMSLTKAEVSR